MLAQIKQNWFENVDSILIELEWKSLFLYGEYEKYMGTSNNNGNCLNRSSLTKKILLKRFYLGIVPSYNVFKYLVKRGLYVEID